MRGVLVLILVCAGCGRLGFERDPGGPPGDASPDAPAIDAPAGLAAAPAVPRPVCKVAQLAAPTPALADLAIAATDEGYTAIWVDTRARSAAHAVRLDADHQQLAARDLSYLTDTWLGGALHVGSVLMVASSTGTTANVIATSPDLATASRMTQRTGQLASRDPFAPDAGNTGRLFVSASGDGIQLAQVADDGAMGPLEAVTIGTTKRELACTYGPDHGHCVWAEDTGVAAGLTRCVVADVKLREPPEVGASGSFFDGGCNTPRAAPGIGAEEPMVVWTTPAGQVMGRYLKGLPDDSPLIEIAGTGSAPRIQYDGAQFWVAWLDPSGTLQLASVDESSQIVRYPMPGWVPNGPEAFELVRRASGAAGTDIEVVLAVLREGELDVLTICPP